MTLLCQEFNALPSDGGILEQDQLWMRKMIMVVDAQNEARQAQKEKKTPTRR